MAIIIHNYELHKTTTEIKFLNVHSKMFLKWFLRRICNFILIFFWRILLKEKSVFRHCNKNFEEKNKLSQKEDRQNRFTIPNYFSLQNDEITLQFVFVQNVSNPLYSLWNENVHWGNEKRICCDWWLCKYLILTKPM